MLYEELKKIAPPLSAFLQKVAPELTEEDVTVMKPKSIPKSIKGRGRCYLFSYRNPINKGTPELPYYHYYPMVISLQPEQENLLGLNPFYLPPRLREELINGIMGRLLGEEDDPDTRASISYKIISKYRRSFGVAFPCIKRYTHVRMSPVILEMKPSLWRRFYLEDISKRHEKFFLGRNLTSIWGDSKIKAIEESRVINRRKK